METKTNFYEGLLEWDSLKIFYLCFHIFSSLIGPVFLYCIVWYEKFSTDLHVRTVLNQLLTYLCYIIFIMGPIAKIPHVAFFFVGPFSDLSCDLFILLGRYSFVCVLMEMTLRQAVKYFYIFQWKSVVGLNDDFAAAFLTLWNLVLSAGNYLIRVFLIVTFYSKLIFFNRIGDL